MLRADVSLARMFVSRKVQNMLQCSTLPATAAVADLSRIQLPQSCTQLLLIGLRLWPIPRRRTSHTTQTSATNRRPSCLVLPASTSNHAAHATSHRLHSIRMAATAMATTATMHSALPMSAGT